MHPSTHRTTITLLLALCLVVSGLPLHAQQENNQGFGSLLRDQLRTLMDEGAVFMPNGTSAQPVEASGEESAESTEEQFSLNFNNAPIEQLLKFISDLTQKVVLRTDDVQGQINIINPGEVTRNEALEIIDAALMLKNITLIESEQMIFVVPTSLAKLKGVDVSTGLDDPITGTRIVRQVIQLQYAAAGELREALEPLLSENANIIADDRTQSLIITDTADNVNSFASIIRELDKEDVLSGVVVRVFRLRYLDASQLVRDLDDLLENIVIAQLGGNDGGGRNVNVEVLSDRATNSLIISAPADAIDEVAAFIEKLDISKGDSLKTQTFTLTNGNAEDVAQSLNTIAQSHSSSNYRPTIVADTRTNTLVVTAYPDDLLSFAELIETLDSKRSYEKVTKVFVLKNADAINLTDMLETLLSGDTSQNTPWWARQNNQSESETNIIADQRLNALVVTARPGDFPLIEDMIQQLDMPLPESAEDPRVYPLTYSRAADVAQIITQLFDPTSSSGGGFFFSIQSDEITGLSGKIRVIADSTSNSLIVLAATPRAFVVIEKLIEKLDRDRPEMGSTRIYSLRNADATAMSNDLNLLFEEDNQQGNQGFFFFQNQNSAGSEQISNLIGNVRIVPVTRTNSLMVTTNSQFFPTIDGLVAELDREIAQVLIEILIVEVTDIDDNQLGIDWPNEVPISVEGNFDAPISGINLDRAGVISSTRFDMFLDFLAQDDNTNVIARPDILTGDNRSAFVEVINRIPFPSQLTVGTATTNQEIDYQEVGLKLTVSPQINDATMVTVDVDLENGQIIEALGLQSTLGLIPAFSRRTVQTRLTVHSGETAVLSGVIDNTMIESESGIPGLKEIPVLGYLFKSRGQRNTKRELMAFITPYILETREDRAQVFDRHNNRLQQYEAFGDQLKDLDYKIGVE